MFDSIEMKRRIKLKKLIDPFSLENLWFVIHHAKEIYSKQNKIIPKRQLDMIRKFNRGISKIENICLVELKMLNDLIPIPIQETHTVIDTKLVYQLLLQYKNRPKYIYSKANISRQQLYLLLKDFDIHGIDRTNRMRLKTFLILNDLVQQEIKNKSYLKENDYAK